MFRLNPETRCKCHDHTNEISTGTLLLLAAFLILAFPSAGRATTCVRFIPEFSGTDITPTTSAADPERSGDFAGLLVGGFFLDYTSAARYASIHYDTFAQLLRTSPIRSGRRRPVCGDDRP